MLSDDVEAFVLFTFLTRLFLRQSQPPKLHRSTAIMRRCWFSSTMIKLLCSELIMLAGLES